MSDEKDVWLVSTDEEQWSDGEEFASREEALAWGRAEYSYRSTLWTGKRSDPKLPTGETLVDDIIARIGEVAYDQAGEAAENWPAPSKDERAPLEAALEKLVSEWIREKCPPSFFCLTEVEQHDVEVTDAK